MNTEYQDILTTIASHPGITSADIAERMEIKGYYSNLKTADAASRVSKIADKLRSKGFVVSEKTKPITGNPVNVWTVIPEAHAAIPRADDHSEDSLNMAEDMASDVAELALKQETTDESTTQPETTTAEPIALKDMTELVPFNLERAIAGDPVITGDGEKVTHLTYYPINEDDSPLIGLIHFSNGKTARRSWYSDGKFCWGEQGKCDLFMAELNHEETMSEIAPEYTADELTDAVLEAAMYPRFEGPIEAFPKYSVAITHKSVAFAISSNPECEGNVEMDEEGILLYTANSGFFFRDAQELNEFFSTLYRAVRSYEMTPRELAESHARAA